MVNLEDVQIAYRKLKGSVYLDKTLPFLRNRIVEYESSKLINGKKEYIDNRLENLYNVLDSDEDVWNNYEEKLLESIKVLAFPKNIESVNKNCSDLKIITNKPAQKLLVSEINNFIDMEVECHIIGVLWILKIGIHLDNDLIKTCYGNRVYDNLINEGKYNMKSSPYLMKPYFQQYETWRDEALKISEDFTYNKEKNVLLTMLDLNKYYYSIELNETMYNSITEPYLYEENIIEKRLNTFVFNVLLRYSEILQEGKKEALLPIGFLPSNILANYYLKDFDNEVLTEINPLYYGRYVDDMIIVTQADDGSGILEHKDDDISSFSENIIEFLCDRNIIKKQINEDSYYLNKYENLKIQKKKFRFFYFDKNGSKGILEKIRKDIANNTSEFNFMPIEEENLTRDYINIYKLEREDSVNKISGINDIQIGKYELSKLIAKHLTISKFGNNDLENEFINELDKIFDLKTIISNYTLWESIINYYVVNDKIDKISMFVDKILIGINGITYKEELKENKDKIKNSLIIYLICCISRSLAIVWGKDVKELINKISGRIKSNVNDKKIKSICTYDKIKNYRKKYISSKMINKYLIPISLNECMRVYKANDDYEAKMYSFDSYFKSEIESKKEREGYKYTPYLENPFNISFTKIMKHIKASKSDSKFIPDNDELSHYMIDEFTKNFWNFENNNIKILSDYMQHFKFSHTKETDKIKSIININNESNKDVFRIGISNVKLEQENFNSMLLDQKVSKYKKYNDIAKIVNEAIIYDVDMLIMPESYVPIEYLPLLQRKMSSSNMCLICGIEHIKVNNCVYNLTAILLPLINDKFRYTIPFFHQKVHYSPSEKIEIEDKRYSTMEGNEYTLYGWNNLWFAPYCCFELTSIIDRSIFQSYADLVVAVEWNKDTTYFSNIIESLSRDLHCYCAQANTSEYGDSRVTQPSNSYKCNIIRVKGGINSSILVGEIDVNKLRKFQLKGLYCQNTDKEFKPTPPNLNKEIIKEKMHNRLFEYIMKQGSKQQNI